MAAPPLCLFLLFMSNLLEFPKKNQPEAPTYAGHVLMLDLAKARRWQCFNFWLGVRCRMALVPEDASMDLIHDAVQAGILIDITEHPELFVPEKPVAEVRESDTGQKIYSGTRRFFRELGINGDTRDSDPENETVAYATADAGEQSQIEEALRLAPVAAAAPLSMEEARQRAARPRILIAPGMDNPEKYTLSIPGWSPS